MRPRPAGRAVVWLVLLLPPAALARADIIHLKNGGTIVADSWEDRGEVLIVLQDGGRISVPRADVERIEATRPARPVADPAASPGSTPASGPPDPTGAPVSQAGGIMQSTDDEIQGTIEVLKRRINDYPLARAENTRRLVALLDQLGGRALKARDLDAAVSRFREALACDPKDSAAQVGLAAAYFRQGQDIFARSTLERALLDHPDNPALHALLGDVYNSQERTEEALQEWQRAHELKPDASLKAKIDKLARERSVDSGYRQSEAAHFTLKHDGDRTGADLGGQIVEYLESQFRTLQSRFDHYPLQPIVVIVYPQKQFYEATQADANVGGLFDGKIRVPIGGLRQITAEARRVLLHELAHAFIAGKSRGTAPRWLHEGLAQQIEGKTTPTATGVTLAKEFDALDGKGSWGQAFTYASALSFVEWLDERIGFAALVDVLEVAGQGIPPETAFEQVTRYSLMELRQAWGEALVRKYLQ
ncbi:MAG: tetratricopeptide repeat protein [Acidobacteria bacterium]|nr:tetratricopeptide repeat protein [Acidobacteriota bacterium]